MYYVYRFLDKNKNIIYIGKSKQDLEQRFRGHLHLPNECYSLVYKIEYIECSTESDMSIKEIYYINKYKNEHFYFNVLDKTELPTSVEFTDKWKMYKGPLESQFCNSINYKKGYTSERKIRYNKDGSVDKRKQNKEKGTSSYVEALTGEEVNMIIEHLIYRINTAENKNQEQIRFRNLLMFVLGVNLPHKTKEFLFLKYKDLFDEDDQPKQINFILTRFHQNQSLNIPLRKIVQDVLVAYKQRYNLTYKVNANDYLFESREHQVISLPAWWKIIDDSIKSVGINKNIGAESLRKTYAFNIYQHSENQLNSLLFLGELWGKTRESQIIKYLNLTNEDIDYNYYFGETFSLGNVDLKKINCINNQVQTVSNLDNDELRKTIESKNTKLNESVDKRKKLTEEQRKEIKEVYSTGRFSLNDLANRFGVSKKTILLIVNKDSAEKNKKYKQEHWKQWQKSDKDRSEGAKKEKTLVETPKKNTKTNRLWTVEMKMEIIEKHLFQKIPQKVLAEEYNVDKGAISRWISTYKQYGKSALEDKRFKEK